MVVTLFWPNPPGSRLWSYHLSPKLYIPLFGCLFLVMLSIPEQPSSTPFVCTPVAISLQSILRLLFLAMWNTTVPHSLPHSQFSPYSLGKLRWQLTVKWASIKVVAFSIVAILFMTCSYRAYNNIWNCPDIIIIAKTLGGNWNVNIDPNVSSVQQLCHKPCHIICTTSGPAVYVHHAYPHIHSILPLKALFDGVYILRHFSGLTITCMPNMSILLRNVKLFCLHET